MTFGPTSSFAALFIHRTDYGAQIILLTHFVTHLLLIIPVIIPLSCFITVIFLVFIWPLTVSTLKYFNFMSLKTLLKHSKRSFESEKH